MVKKSIIIFAGFFILFSAPRTGLYVATTGSVVPYLFTTLSFLLAQLPRVLLTQLLSVSTGDK